MQTWILTIEISSGEVLLLRMIFMTVSEACQPRHKVEEGGSSTLQFPIKGYLPFMKYVHFQWCFGMFLSPVNMTDIKAIHRSAYGLQLEHIEDNTSI